MIRYVSTLIRMKRLLPNSTPKKRYLHSPIPRIHVRSLPLITPRVGWVVWVLARDATLQFIELSKCCQTFFEKSFGRGYVPPLIQSD